VIRAVIDPCTQTDTCRGCVVTGTGPDGFSCTGPASPDGATCADESGADHRCTNDVCKGGECIHPPKECPASDRCVTSSCNPETGRCEEKKSGAAGCKEGPPSHP
jgi:hypothetical protein